MPITEDLKNWRKNNPEKVNAANRRAYAKHADKRKEAKRLYYQANKTKFRLRERNREKKIKNELTEEEWRFVVSAYGGKCLNCGTGEDITMDHIKPISKGGRHHSSNVQPLCRSCNSSKGNKEVDFRP